MGQDKALLPFGESTMLEFLLRRLRRCCEEVILVTHADRPYHDLRTPVIFDVMPEKSSLGGLYSGLLLSPADVNFVCACDMPLIQPALVERLFELFAGVDAVLPEIDGRLEPLCAIYSKACLPAIHERLLAQDLRMTGWLKQVRTRLISKSDLLRYDPRLDSLCNVNTAADYQRLLQLTAEELAV